MVKTAVAAPSIFEVDRKGLAKILARKGKAFAILELLQNAWDEKGVTQVHITFTQEQGRASLTVDDDAPEGFADMSHAYVLFAESRKKDNPEQRGRFNLGEKLVIAICDYVAITSTKGQVIFDDAGRHETRLHRAIGTLFEAELRMNQQEADELRKLVASVLPPHGITTTFNGEELRQRDAIRELIGITLPTERADAEGFLRPTARATTLILYEPLEGERATLYEMGIPVVETGDRYHIDVQQKVPLNSDRDNVTPSYLQKVRVAVLNHMAQDLQPEQATATWVAAALEDERADLQAVKAIVTARYGDKVVISDPSDPEGTKMAVAAGYTVLAPRTFSREAWANVKAAGVLPAGQVTPSPRPYGDGLRPENTVPEENWTEVMFQTGAFVNRMAPILIGHAVQVKIVREPTVAWVANYGPGHPLTLNLSKLGHNWFGQVGSEHQIELLLHEFAHERVSDHLSHQFADGVARLGAKLAMQLAGRPSGRLHLEEL